MLPEFRSRYCRGIRYQVIGNAYPHLLCNAGQGPKVAHTARPLVHIDGVTRAIFWISLRFARA